MSWQDAYITSFGVDDVGNMDLTIACGVKEYDVLWGAGRSAPQKYATKRVSDKLLGMRERSAFKTLFDMLIEVRLDAHNSSLSSWRWKEPQAKRPIIQRTKR